MADVRETVEKKGIWDDVLNLLKTIEDNSEKRCKELRGVIHKSFEEFDKLKDALAKPCKLLKNKERHLSQVSSLDNRGNNDDDTCTDNSVSLRTDEIIDDKVSEDSENIWVNHNKDTGKCSENINNADKLKEKDLNPVSYTHLDVYKRQR